ncbi:hypothetical protein EJ03DRAFT_372585 [Teratosphaeria nubilosa]|uniref:Uncharacterized protein n=1 Tax=Teratosphaeria nubilosa TaxID=161662 RepID=A0A6G1LFF1_9PEZI|nr:hypothetical protein EJ03DRAFT_372585 [Teratosphaeria nubilosa]
MDPRRPGYNPDYAAKRKPSRSPPGGAPSKSQRTGNGSDAADTPTSGRPASPALMTAAPTPAESLVDMLMAFGNQCSKVASTNVVQMQAQMTLDRANAEYRKMSEHFQTFPQIREQKTAAKNKAEKSLKAATADLNQHRDAQKDLATCIATLVAKAQSAASKASAADIKLVEQKCNALEKKLDGSNNPFSAADRQRIEDKCKDLEQQLGHLKNMIKDHQSFEGQIKDLTRKYTLSEKDVKAIDSRLLSLENHVAGDSGDSLQAKALALTAQTEQFKINSKTNEQTDTWNGQAIQARFEHEKDLARDENEKRDQAIAQYVENGIKEVKEDIEAVSQQVTTMSHARNQDVAQVNALRIDMVADMSAVKDRLVTVESKTEDYESVKSAVGNHAQEISNLKAEVSTKADKEYVAGAMQKVTREQHAVQPPSRTPTPGTVLHGSSNGNMTPQANGFHSQANLNLSGQPRAGSFSNPSSFDAEKKITELQQQADMLSYVTQRLQTQYNNLTTESVCQAMLDQLGEVWPHAKNWEGWVNEFKARQAEFDRQKEEMKGQVSKLAMDADMALKAAKEAKDSSAATTQITSAAESRSEPQAKACQNSRQELDGVLKQLTELESQGRKELVELSGRVNTIATEFSKVKGTFQAWEESRG